MEILVGRGGNQSMPITDESVSRIHCKIEVMDSGHIVVTNLSASGTWLNGSRIIKRTIVKPQDTLRLGPSFSATIEQLTASTNYEAYTGYLSVLRKYPTTHELQVFINTSSQRIEQNVDHYVMHVVKSAMAYCLIDEGKYWEAQKLIYEVGDAIYDMQDGSEKLQCIYATILTVCARLYLFIGRLDVAKEAILGAAGIFNRLSYYDSNVEEQRTEAFHLAAEILTKLGDKEQAEIFINNNRFNEEQ